MVWIDLELQPSSFMHWLYHWLVMCDLPAPVQFHDAQTNNTFTFMIRTGSLLPTWEKWFLKDFTAVDNYFGYFQIMVENAEWYFSTVRFSLQVLGYKIHSLNRSKWRGNRKKKIPGPSFQVSDNKTITPELLACLLSDISPGLNVMTSSIKPPTETEKPFTVLLLVMF